MGMFFRGLARTRKNMSEVAAEVDAAYAALRDNLIMADVGLETAAEIEKEARAQTDDLSPRRRLAAAVAARLLSAQKPLSINTDEQKPFVIMMMGVNGGGKTTTIAKLCRYFTSQNKKVLLAAGDTFRAAAREQLREWAGREGAVETVCGDDPGAVAFDGVRRGVARECDIVIIDTAGRLPAQTHLMAELGKIHRAVGKALPGAPHESLLVLDATLGRGAITQAEAFAEAGGVNGLVLSKLDGSAKGGFLVSLAARLPLPVRFVGVGESAEDLIPFDAQAYADALLGLE